MKSILLLLLTLPFAANSQKLVENKIDEFTKHSVKRTSWESLAKAMSYYTYCRVSKIDSTYWLDLKMFTSGTKAVREKAELMLMTVSDSVVTLYNSEYEISCTGCAAIGFAGSAAPGLNMNFMIPPKYINYLSNNPIKKIRLYSTDGYIEKEIKEKVQDAIQKQIELVK